MRYHLSFTTSLCALTLLIIIQGAFFVQSSFGQATCTTPTNIFGFGVDGDVRANTPAAIMGDSWFYSGVNPGSGIGVIGNSAATATPPLSSAQFGSIVQSAGTGPGRNRIYQQRMSVPSLTTINGNVLIDAFAARDNISPDSTTFLGSNKNGDNPTLWSVGLSSVPNKNDIIDVAGHLRRNIASGKLFLYAFITKLSTGGSAYSDIEIYRSVPYIDPATGNFTNTGPAATGGHTTFTFTNNATIQTPGDIILCMNYSSSGGVASIKIWCNINNLDGNGNGYTWFNTRPGRPFNFTGDFITGTGGNGYGYAEIVSLSGAPCLMYSVLNSANTPAGDWGNMTSSSATYDTNIEPEQLVNIAFNFTDIGLDFASLVGPCHNMFGSLWFKTRSSASFSSELKDCSGPYSLANFTEIQAAAGPDRSLNCTTSQITINGSSAPSTATVSWTTPNGNIVSGANTNSPVVNMPGTYIMSAQSSITSSCIATDTVIVTLDIAAPNVSAGADKVLTCASTSLILNGTSTTPGVSYSWSATGGGNIVSGGSSANATVNAVGCYILTITNPSNGCINSDTTCVTMNNSVPAISGITQTNVSCFAACNGAISFNTTGGQSPFTYQWSNGASTSTLSGICAGIYTVTVTGANGCTTSNVFNLSQPSGTLTSSVTVTQNVNCNGGSNGAVTASASAGTSPYTFLWSNGANTSIINGLFAGTYTVTVTDINGCTSQATASITQPVSALASTLTVTQNVSCNGGSDGAIDLSPSGGTTPYTYLWNNGTTTQDLTNISSGTYTVTVTDANGCTVIRTGTVTQPAAELSTSIASTQSVSCFEGTNGSIDLNVAGGTSPYGYVWNNGATTQDISNITAGSYTVTVTDAKGCTSVRNVVITQPAAALSASASATQNVSCFGGNNGSVNLNVTGGTNPYSYSWSNGASSQNLSGVTSGTYTVTVTDVNGCVANSNVAVTQPSAALSSTLNVSQTVSCFGGNDGSLTLSVANGTSPYTYLWNTGATSQNISSLSVGTYTVTITDANGCTNVRSATVNQPAAALDPVISVGQQVSCFGGSNGAISLSVSGGTAPYTYNWSNGASVQNLSGLVVGTYTVTVTDFRGCTMSKSATITQPSAALTPSVNSSTNVNCYGGNNGSVNLMVSGGTTPYIFSWSNGASSQNLSGLSAGTYTVTVTDANGCTANQSTSITQPSAALSGNASVTQNVNCFGGNNGAIALTVNGGTSPYGYAWSNGSTSQNLTGLGSGNYTVTVTDAQGCTIIQNATITQPSAALGSTISVSQDVSCFGGSNGQILLSVTGGTSPYSFSWSNGATSQNVSNLAAGSYTVTVTDDNGCTSVKNATVTQPAQSLSGSTTVTSNISCFSGNNGAIDLTVVGGTAPYTFNWSTGAFSEDLAGLAAGSYTVTITDANGCSAQSSGTIVQPAGALSTNINISQNIPCYGGGNGAIDLSVTGGTTPYTYIWNTGATSQDINNLPAGVYTVTITDDNGCYTTASGTITQPSAPLASSISANQAVLCFGGNNGSLNLNVTGGTFPYTYNWSNGQTTKDIFNLTAGTYTVTVTDANGCTSLQSGTVAQPSAALSSSAVVLQQVLCFGGNNAALDLSVNGGTVPYTYNWSNGQTTQDLAGLSAGTYTVTITDANACITTRSVTITQPAASLSATASSTQQVSCFGGNNGTASVNTSGGTSPYAYSWSNGATSQNITNLSAGTYTVTVTDANGCTTLSNTSVTQPVAALAGSTSITQQVSCFGGSNGSIDLSLSGGTAPYTYLWSNGATTQNINGLSSGTYTVTVTDANGCTIIRNGIITQPSAGLDGTLSVSQNVSCFGGANGSVQLIISGGTTPYTYSWSTGATTQNLSGLPAGSYTVTVTDANGCTTSKNTTVTQPSASLNAVASINQNVSCFGGNNGSINLAVTGGTSPYSYSWSNGATTQNLSGLTAGLFTVTVTDANGCTYTQNANVGQPAAALSNSLSVGSNVLCFAGNNGEINLNVNGGTSPYTYSWSNGGTSQNQSGLTAGTYTVTITDANGCTSTGSATISQPVAALNGAANTSQNVNCFGGNNGAVSLTISGGTAPYSFNWNNGAIIQNLSNLSAGIYSVTVTDANGCIFNSGATVTQPAATLTSSTSVGQNINCFGGNNGSVNSNASGGTAPYSYNWNTGATSQNITGLPAGVYTVIITDINGCSSTSTASVIQPNESLTTSSTIDQNVSCFSGANGAASVNASGGTAPYTYLWNTGSTSNYVTGLSAGNYSVTVTDANGCTSVQTVVISQPAAALNSTVVVQQQVSCFGGNNGSIDVSVSGGTSPYTYLWNNGAITQDLNNLTSGVYTVVIVDNNGCTTQQSATVTQPAAALTPSIAGNVNVSCFAGNNGSIDLAVSGGTAPYTYVWNTGAVTQDISGLVSGSYTVTITDANGCTAIQNSTITQPSASLSSNANISQNVNCFGGNNGAITLTVNGGTSPYTFVWNNGATTQNINGIISGSYTVTVTDAQGCTTQQSATVSQPAAALSTTINASQQVSCFGGNNGQISLTPNGGTSPYSYVWSNGSVTQSITSLTAGTYTVTVTDINGCTSENSATVTQPVQALSGSTTVTSNISCFSGNNGAIDLTVVGGTSPYTFNWSTGASTEDLAGLSAGSYTVTITDANGCSAVSNGTITQPAGSLSTNINISQNIPCYGGGSGAIDLTVNGGTLPYVYNWSNGATTQDISNLSAGVYTVTITDANGCNTTSAGTITQPSAPLSSSVNSSQPVLCFGGNNGSLGITATGGTFPYTYLWNNNETSSIILNLSAGTYTVTVTDANGCTDVQSGIVSQPAAAISSVASVTANVLCFGGNNGAVDLTVSGGTAPYSFNWSNGQTSQNLSGLTSGIYTVTITDANGCIANQTATITQPAASLSSGASSTQQVACFAGNNGEATVIASGGTNPYSYLWSNGSSNQTINNLVAGTYTVTVTDANGCTASSNTIVSQPAAALSGTATVNNNVDCYGGSNGAINLAVAGGTTPYSYVWSDGTTTQNISGLSSGTYTVTVTDGNGCTISQSAQITQPNAALNASTSVSANVLCFSGNNGSVDLTVNGGTTPYNYSWSNGSTNEDINNLVAGWYFVTITDANGCVTSDSAEVTQPGASLSSSISSSQPVLCFGGNNGSVDLNVIGGTAPYSFIWSNGENTEDISGLSTGTYSVTITDANGCTNMNSVFIDQPFAPLSTSVNGSTNILCFGGNNGMIDLTVSGGTQPYTYLWSNSEITEDINSLIAGTYTVTVTDVNGCTESLSLTLTEPAAALNSGLSVTQQVDCFAGENGAIDLTVSGGTSPYSFVWSNGATTEDLSLLFAGTYTVTITDVNGCTVMDQIDVIQPTAPVLSTITVVSNVFCNGGATGSLDLTVNGGTSPYTYVWSNGATTEDISNLATGIYTVTVTDANGCTNVASAGIGQPSQQLNANANVQHVLCFNGNNGLIDISPSGGTLPYVFIWSNGATTEDIGVLVAGIYTVTITDANGCDTTLTFPVTQPQAPLIPVLTIGQHVSCFDGSDGSMNLLVSGGTTPYVYLWSNGATTANINNLPAGQYTVTITDGNGCNAIISDVVTQPATPVTAPIVNNQQVSCFGGSNGVVTANATGGTPPYTYLWSTGSTNASINNLSIGTYTVTVTDNNGCTYTGSTVVTEPAAPLSVSGSATIANCIMGVGGTITTTVAGGTAPYTFNWSNGATTQNLLNAAPGSYSVTITDANGCITNGTYIVENDSEFNLSEAGPHIICVGETVILVADSIPGGNYQWYFQGIPLNGATGMTFETPAAGFYSVSVTVPCGTFYTDSVEVIVKSVENASITSNQIICPPETVQLHATGGVIYQWTPATFISSTQAADPIVGPTVFTTYTVEITNEWGCKTELSVDIAVACDTLFVPNGFSPNNDGVNDGYVIDHIDNYPGNKLWVYNRWGNLVYKAKDYDNSWDGTSNISGIYMGQKVPTGTYFFILDLNDNSKPYSGYLIIRR